jgi:phage tail sheath protein FI
MSEYLAPGVYVEEISPGLKPIEGVNTSTVGMVGMTEKGTTTEKPTLVTNFTQFKQKFGSYLGSEFGNHRFLAYAVRGFFQNGGKSIYIVSVGRNDIETDGYEAYIGIDIGPGHRTGLQALQDTDQISIVAIPGITDIDVQSAILNQCEKLKDRFAILEIPEHYKSLFDIQVHRKKFDSKYGALYHPWLKIFDPLEKRNLCIPPSGHIAGIYTRTDSERGVHKAPANEIIKGIKKLKYGISNKENELLDSSSNYVNVLRDFRRTGRGIRVWGARTISSDSLWKYINVRRLLIYVEESNKAGTQWVVFEPNKEKLWARVKQTITAFLTRVWRDGALMGATPEEAFFIICDRNTMTQDDIDNGRLICEIGIAPVKPAEFVIFRIAQWAGGSEVSE